MTAVELRASVSRMAKKRISDVGMLPIWGARLKRARAALGLMQKDVAADTGVGEKTLSNWENGVAPPSPWFLCRFEELYSIGPDYILCGKMGSLPVDIATKIRDFSVEKS